MSASVVVPGREVRLPQDARDAVRQHRPVEVQSHGKPVFYIVDPDAFATVAPILERRRRGEPVPVTDLLTDDDFAVLAEERERDAGLDAGVLADWES